MPQDKDLDKYLRILTRLRAGKPVSKEEIKHFATYSQDVDEGKLAKIRQKLSDGGLKNLSDEDVSSLIDEGKKALTSDTYKDQTLALAKDAEAGRISDKVAAGLNTVLAGSDIASSIKQINTGNKLAADNPKPGRPTVLGQDNLLAQALNQAQQGTFDQSRALQPAQLGILNNYLSDINNAKQVSSGQSGVYGSLAQVASNRRNAANQELMPLADNIKAREQGRLDNLIGMRMNQTQNNFQNQAQLYGNDLEQYNNAQRIAGALGATGRTNLRNAYADLGQQIPGAVGQAVANSKYDNIYNQMSNYGHDNAMAAVNAHKMLDQRMNPYSNLTSDDDIQYFNQAY